MLGNELKVWDRYMAPLRDSNGTTLAYSLDSVVSSSLGGSFLRCWRSSYGLWRFVTCSQQCRLETVLVTFIAHLPHCALWSVSDFAATLTSSPTYLLFQTYLCGVRTLSVRGTVRTFPDDCRYYDRISILCKPPKYDDATSHWSVFVYCHVSPSVVGPNVLKHRQSVFRAWHATLPAAFASNAIGHRSHFVSFTFWIPLHYRRSGEPFCEHLPEFCIHFEEIISRARGNFETKIRYWRRLQ